MVQRSIKIASWNEGIHASKKMTIKCSNANKKYWFGVVASVLEGKKKHATLPVSIL